MKTSSRIKSSKQLKPNSKTGQLENTGERMIPEHHKGTFIYGEHIVRYGAAVALVKDKVVLDIACGTGYGSQMLAQHAQQVYGVDVDGKTIGYAQKHFSAPNVTFKQGDATKIPLPDRSVDVVITFETIEHIENYEQFMKEIKRVLRPKGIAVISTPNDKEFSEGNHFHIHEFEHHELLQLIDGHFKYKQEYFQGTWIYNALLTAGHFNSDWNASLPIVQAAPKNVDKCLYFYVVCSDEAIASTPIEMGAISHHWSARDEQKAGDEANEYVASLREHIASCEGQIQALTVQRDKAVADLERLHHHPVLRTAKKVRAAFRR